MKKFRFVVAIALVLSMCVCLCACGLEKSDVVGTWVGSYTYNGNQFQASFVLGADGKYTKITFKNGALSSTDSGTYEVKGKKVRLHSSNGVGGTTEYKYKGGALVNNGHKFYKS